MQNHFKRKSSGKYFLHSLHLLHLTILYQTKLIPVLLKEYNLSQKSIYKWRNIQVIHFDVLNAFKFQKREDWKIECSQMYLREDCNIEGSSMRKPTYCKMQQNIETYFKKINLCKGNFKVAHQQEIYNHNGMEFLFIFLAMIHGNY